MYNEVGVEGGITVDGVRSFLNANKNEDIQFDISTLGGDLSQAITIYSLIKAHAGKTIANIIGLTASAGTVIAAACDERIISDNALFLIHNGWTSVTGNTFDLQKTASDLMKNDAIMVKIYREVTGMKDEDIKNLMKASDWMTPEEALNYGFVDSITPTNQKIAASAMLTEAQAALLNISLTNKLKMKIFGKEKKDTPIMNVLSLADGKQCLISAELPATGVEIAPLGAMGLDDGEYTLDDGRVITVAGGVITDVKEVATPAPPAAAIDTNEVVAAVSAVVLAEMAKIEAKFDTKLAAITSKHVPAKGIIVSPSASAPVSVQTKIKEMTDEIRANIENSRKA